MISTFIRLGWLDLKRDAAGLALAFVLPVVFFSVFALVFEGIDGSALKPVTTAFVLENDEKAGRDLLQRLQDEKSVDVLVTASREEGLALVRAGMATAAVIIPPDFGAGPFGSPGTQIEIHADESKPVPVAVVEGTVRGALMGTWLDVLSPGLDTPTGLPGAIKVVDAIGNAQKRPSVAFFAAGIGVMFLLFAMAGRSGILIEERESGVLTRMLAGGVELKTLLVGRWLSLVLLGVTQVSLMFLWGWLVFGLDLFAPTHLVGFGIMTVATAAAAAAFGLFLATLCRTRGQLDGVMVVVVLIMSALGGSMFPRFLMPEALERVGLLTFNAWALDGYRKVFWYDRGVLDLWPQVAVLGLTTVVFLLLAGAQARRWARG